MSAVPLAAHFPSAAVTPDRRQAQLLAVVVAAQFCAQFLLNRGFQLLSATRGSAVNVLQVRGVVGWWVSGWVAQWRLYLTNALQGGGAGR